MPLNCSISVTVFLSSIKGPSKLFQWDSIDYGSPPKLLHFNGIQSSLLLFIKPVLCILLCNLKMSALTKICCITCNIILHIVSCELANLICIDIKLWQVANCDVWRTEFLRCCVNTTHTYIMEMWSAVVLLNTLNKIYDQSIYSFGIFSYNYT